MRILSRALLASACVVLVAAPPVLAAGKSLKETLAYLRDHLAGQGEINYKIKLHDSADGSDWSNEMSGRATNVTYDVANCTISYHWNTTSDGKQIQDFDASWNLRNGRKVSVGTSIGIALAVPKIGDSPSTLIDAAERALQLAKERGRGRTEVARASEELSRAA